MIIEEIKMASIVLDGDETPSTEGDSKEADETSPTNLLDDDEGDKSDDGGDKSDSEEKPEESN